MKRIFSFLMVAAIIMGLSANAFSKDFKGVITYKITFPGMDIDPSMAAMMPKVATLAIRGDLSKFEISMGQMGKQMSIVNGTEKTVTTCMDMMGQKFFYVQDEEAINEELGDVENVDFQIKDETKEIAGYECKKAQVTINNDGNEMMFTIYFTEEIGTSRMNFNNPYFKDVPGAMLEFEIDTGGGQRMKMEAVSVDKKNVADSEFEVPEGYEEKTQKELEQMFGGGM